MAKKTIKTVIICSDGAIKGGYVAGVFLSLKEKSPKIWDTVTDITGVSGSVGGLFYELSHGKKNPGKYFWTQLFSDKKLINKFNIFRGKKVYDVDYLVDILFKIKNPLNTKNIQMNKLNIYFPLIEYKTGNLIIFTNSIQNSKNKNYKLIKAGLEYDYIKAAIAAPILYDKTVEIEGKKYIDAGLRLPFFFDHQKFKNHKKIIISTKKNLSFLETYIYKILGLIYYSFNYIIKSNLNKRYYHELKYKPNAYFKIEREINKLNHKNNLVHIYPSKKLGSVFDNTKKTLLKNYNLGKYDYLSYQKELEMMYK